MTLGVAVVGLDGEGGLGDQHGDGLMLAAAAEVIFCQMTMITPVLLARRHSFLRADRTALDCGGQPGRLADPDLRMRILAHWLDVRR